jgi:hypothetical protein
MGLARGLAITPIREAHAMPLLPELVPSEDDRCYKIGVGMAHGSATPPSEPDGRISRIRLSSQWLPVGD